MDTSSGSSVGIVIDITSGVDELSNYATQSPYSEKTNKVLLGLQKAARLGDVAIQHSPEVTALVWAGVRFILEVYLNSIFVEMKITN